MKLITPSNALKSIVIIWEPLIQVYNTILKHLAIFFVILFHQYKLTSRNSA